MRQHFPAHIPLISFVVIKDIAMQIPTTIPKHELPLLQAGHSDHAVNVEDEDGFPMYQDTGKTYCVETPASEYERLEMKYGKEILKRIFPTMEQLGKAIVEVGIKPVDKVTDASQSLDDVYDHDAVEVVDDEPVAVAKAAPKAKTTKAKPVVEVPDTLAPEA